MDNNISYFLNETETETDQEIENGSDFECGNNQLNLASLMYEFENIPDINELKHGSDNGSENEYGHGLLNDLQSDFLFSEMNNYIENYTVKQLMQVCEYYNISKEVKSFKYKKQGIINYLLIFENNIENFDVVMKRKQFWYYITELKNDKFMKKFVIWD